MLVVQPDQEASAKTERFGRIWWAIAWLGIAAGVFFRVYRLGFYSLWFDEGYTAWMVSHPPSEIIRLIRADTAPPLYYLLLRGWTDCFGRSEAALRSLSTVFSIITLLIAMDIARRLLRRPAAIAAAAWVMGLSFLQIWYAQEARAYALMALLGVGAFDFLLRHLAGKGRGWLIPLAATIAAAMYTHNMMAPYVIALLLAWLILPSDHSTRRRFSEMAAVVLIALVLYLPWAIRAFPGQLHMIQHAFWVERLKAGNFLIAIAALAGVQQFWSWATIFDKVHLPVGHGFCPAIITVLLITASAALSICGQPAARRREALGLLIMALFPPLAIAAYSVLRTPLFMQKVFLPSATFMPLFILLPLATSSRPGITKGVRFGAGLLLVLCALTLYGHEIEDTKEDWRQVADVVAKLRARHRLIVFVANDGQLPFDYYYRYLPGDEATGVPGGFFDLDPPRTMRRMPEDGDLKPLESRLSTGDYDQIVLVIAHDHWGDPDHLTEAFLAKKWQVAGRALLNDVSVQWYAPK